MDEQTTSGISINFDNVDQSPVLSPPYINQSPQQSKFKQKGM